MSDAVSIVLLVGGTAIFLASMVYLRAYLRFRRETANLFRWDAGEEPAAEASGGMNGFAAKSAKNTPDSERSETDRIQELQARLLDSSRELVDEVSRLSRRPRGSRQHD